MCIQAFSATKILKLLLSDERTGEELVKTPAVSMEMQKKAVVPQIEKIKK
jgi:hypothetical protein